MQLAAELVDEDEIGEPDRGLPVWVDRVSKWYGAVIGVNEITLRVESGILALLGPNGAGKSTLIKLLTGQLRPSIGHVRIFGRSVDLLSRRAVEKSANPYRRNSILARTQPIYVEG